MAVISNSITTPNLIFYGKPEPTNEWDPKGVPRFLDKIDTVDIKGLVFNDEPSGDATNRISPSEMFFAYIIISSKPGFSLTGSITHTWKRADGTIIFQFSFPLQGGWTQAYSYSFIGYFAAEVDKPGKYYDEITTSYGKAVIEFTAIDTTVQGDGQLVEENYKGYGMDIFLYGTGYYAIPHNEKPFLIEKFNSRQYSKQLSAASLAEIKQKLDELFTISPPSTTDPFGIGTLLKSFNEFVKPTIDAGIKTVQDNITAAMKNLFTPPKLDEDVLIDTAPIIALGVAGSAMAASIGIYAATTAGDLLHPLKGTGLVPLGISIVDKLGTGLVTTAIAGGFAAAVLSRPLGYYYNRAVRPFRPGGSLIDQMHFEGNLTKAQWKKLYEYQGWPDSLIEAQYKTMFIEPSDRLLLRLFEDPLIEEVWIRQKLKERGYSAADVNVLVGTSKRTARSRQNVARESTFIRLFKEGFESLDILKIRLRSADLTASQITQTLVDAVLQRDIEFRNGKIDVITDNFVKGVIKEDQLRTQLLRIVTDEPLRENIIQKAVITKFKVEKDKTEKLAQERIEKLNDLKIDTVTKAFQEGTITPAQLDTELQGPIPDNEIRAAYVKLQNTILAGRLPKEQKAKVEQVRTPAILNRYIEGFVSKSVLEATLAGIGKTQADIKNLVIQADLDKDTKFRKRVIANFEDLFEKDIITEDIFTAELAHYVTDDTILRQIVTAAKVKKYKKPKLA